MTKEVEAGGIRKTKYMIRDIVEMKSKYYCATKIQESRRYLYEKNIFIRIFFILIKNDAKYIFKSLSRFFILYIFIPR